MLNRLENVEDPDVSVFNVAMPKKKRLKVFNEICPTTSNQNEITLYGKKQKQKQKKRSSQN